MTKPRAYSKNARATVLQVVREAAAPMGTSDIAKAAGYARSTVLKVVTDLHAERTIRIAAWPRRRGAPAYHYDARVDLPDAERPRVLTSTERWRAREERLKLDPVAHAARKARDNAGSPRMREIVLDHLTKAACPMSAREMAPLLGVTITTVQKAISTLYASGTIRRGEWTRRAVGRPTPKFDTRVDLPDEPPPGAKSRAERKAAAMADPIRGARIREQNALYERERRARQPAPVRAEPKVFDWKVAINWSAPK